MDRVFPAAGAEFLYLEPLRVFLAVLGGRVVAALAVVALQRDDLAHWPLLQNLRHGALRQAQGKPAPD